MQKTTMKSNTHTHEKKKKTLRKRHNTKNKTYCKVQIQARLNYTVYGMSINIMGKIIESKEMIIMKDRK